MKRWQTEYKDFVEHIREYGPFPDTVSDYVEKFINDVIEPIIKDEEKFRVMNAYKRAGIEVKELASRNGRLLASLEADSPKNVAFVDDDKFKELCEKA